MDGNSLTYTAGRLDRERAAALDRENKILRSIADRGVVVRPESPTTHALTGVGLWLRELFARPQRPRFA